MNSSLPLLGDKQLLSFLCLRTSKTSSLGVFDECKSHLCFEFISHAICTFCIHIHVKLITEVQFPNFPNISQNWIHILRSRP